MPGVLRSSAAIGPSSPDARQSLPPHAIIPARPAGNASAAIDASTGQLYVVWSDNRFTGTVNQIVSTTSTDGGQTWTGRQVTEAASTQGAASAVSRHTDNLDALICGTSFPPWTAPALRRNMSYQEAGQARSAKSKCPRFEGTSASCGPGGLEFPTITG
jgi:hypothetical protein